MGMKTWVLLCAVTAVALEVAPVYGVVESVEISPSVLIVGQPITFFGWVSVPTLDDELAVHVYPGANCAPISSIASTYVLSSNETYTIANNTVGIYNVTLTFPVTPSSSWVVEKQYQNEIPAGAYSVGVQDVVSGSSVCKNFTVTNQAVPEFSETALTIFLALLAPLYLLRRTRNRPSKVRSSRAA